MLLFVLTQAAPTVTADQALAAYGRLTATASGPAHGCAAGTAPDELVVCGAREAARDRLPMPDDRYAPGEVVRHPGEPPPTTAAFNSGATGEPSHQMQTIMGIARLLRSAVTGEDPGP